MIMPWDDFFIPEQELFQPYQLHFYTEENNPVQSVYLSLPKEKKSVPLIIFFHGGGMISDARETPRGLFNGLYAVAEPRYRLTSEGENALNPLKDAARVIAWCFEHAEEFSIDRDRIFVGGMSAGAYLAAITVMDPDWLAPYGISYRDIAGLCLISGQMTTHFQIKKNLGYLEHAYMPRFDKLAPICHIKQDLPPVFMLTGQSGIDMPARPEENAFTAASLRSIGHTFVRNFHLPGFDHGGALVGCDHLLMKFIADVLKQKNPD